MNIRVRKAVAADVPMLRALIDASVRGLQAEDYSLAQIEGALKSVYGVDSQLISDGTYLVAEIEATPGADSVLAGCGGWSKRKTLYGGDQYAGREDSLLDPSRDAAKIRAFFVHPAWARRGIGSAILNACEEAAIAAGFTRLEMGATLSGVAFYKAKGYAGVEDQSVPLGNGETLAIVRMAKRVVYPPAHVGTVALGRPAAQVYRAAVAARLQGSLPTQFLLISFSRVADPQSRNPLAAPH